MTTDPIADFLTRIRNAGLSRQTKTLVPTSKMNHALAEMLTSEGYIKGFKEILVKKRNMLCLYLRFEEGDLRRPLIEGLQRISKPGLRKYFAANEIPKVRNGFGMGLVSTSKGILTDREARKQGVGGEYLCAIW